MPTITEKPSVGTITNSVAVDRANSALVLGSKVLAELSGAESTTTMNVPAQMLKDLASAVVFLAAGIQAQEAQKSAAPAASTSPTINADVKVTSAYSGASHAYPQLTEWAGKLREKAADLGIKMSIDVVSSFGTYELHIRGQAPKDKLDQLKQAAVELTSRFAGFGGTIAKVESLKYDVI